jgi:hypothetical protein
MQAQTSAQLSTRRQTFPLLTKDKEANDSEESSRHGRRQSSFRRRLAVVPRSLLVVQSAPKWHRHECAEHADKDAEEGLKES